MDSADRAQADDEILLEARIQAARGVPRPARATCIDCGAPIPQERQKLRLERCLPCARVEERRRAWYAPGRG
jgi:RNA polymerase-binding transcription factor DksA